MGCSHSRGLYWPTFWLIWSSGWFSPFLASVRMRVRVCWPSIDRCWVLTALGGVPRPFSRHSLPCVMLTDLGNVVVAFC